MLYAITFSKTALDYISSLEHLYSGNITEMPYTVAWSFSKSQYGDWDRTELTNNITAFCIIWWICYIMSNNKWIKILFNKVHHTDMVKFSFSICLLTIYTGVLRMKHYGLQFLRNMISCIFLLSVI